MSKTLNAVRRWIHGIAICEAIILATFAPEDLKDGPPEEGEIAPDASGAIGAAAMGGSVRLGDEVMFVVPRGSVERDTTPRR